MTDNRCRLCLSPRDPSQYVATALVTTELWTIIMSSQSEASNGAFWPIRGQYWVQQRRDKWSIDMWTQKPLRQTVDCKFLVSLCPDSAENAPDTSHHLLSLQTRPLIGQPVPRWTLIGQLVLQIICFHSLENWKGKNLRVGRRRRWEVIFKTSTNLLYVCGLLFPLHNF